MALDEYWILTMPEYVLPMNPTLDENPQLNTM